MGVHKPNNVAANEIFKGLKEELLKLDPVSFCKQYLKIDGKPLDMDGTGWKFLSDIYRYVAINALEKDGKPVVITKGRQVGCTVTATALEMYFMTSGLFGSSEKYPPIQILHCFPALNNVGKFVKAKLSPMMRTSSGDYIKKHGLSWDLDADKKRTDVPEDTLTEKFFENENMLWIDSNGNNASRIQGMTLDGIFHDEVQRMLKDDINNGIRTLTAAKYGPTGKGIQMFFGTPLGKGSYFWKLWQASDQRYYHLGCVECSHYFNLYTPGSDDWEEIWLHGNTVKCPECGHEQSKEDSVQNGKWIPTRKAMDNGAEPLYVGFHFNQFLIPNMTKEAINNENPKYNPTKSERIWQTDILGEFYSGSAMPMTEEEIYLYCKNPDRGVSSRVLKSDTRQTFMGVDWGGKDDSEEAIGGQSYSTVLVASVGQDGVFQIENAFKMKKNTLEYKKSVIDEMFKRFSVKLMVADIGFGNDIVPDLQREYQSRIWGCINSGTLIKPVKVVPENLSIICNKNLMLDDIFNAMRRGNIKFPLKDSASFEQLNWLIEHCCSMELVKKTVSGNIVNIYEKGTGANDGLMSLYYAYLAWKMVATSHFKVKKHREGVGGTVPVLAYAPNII